MDGKASGLQALRRCHALNSAWRDLSEEWYKRHQYQPQSA